MKKKPKESIFFAHSFEKETLPGSVIGDLEVAAWFQDLLEKRWKVLSGKSAQARPITEKVEEALEDSKAIVGLFTRRHRLEGVEEKYIPSPWLLCECAYALGRHKYQDLHTVAGFRERGVDVNSLGMLAANGMEFPEFDRNHLDQDKGRFNNYLDDLEERIRFGPPGQHSIEPQTYIQVAVQKIFLIYRNGYGTVQNIVDIVIKDADRFMRENEGEIHHRIWTHVGAVPPLAEMLRVPVHKRKNEAFFQGILDTHRNKRIETYLDIAEEKRGGSSCKFAVKFLDTLGQPLKVKANDTLRYQYAWGLPNMFPLNEEELQPVTGNTVSASTYCLAEIDSNHGKIEHVKVELRFEREARSGQRRDLFSKSPFFRTGRGFANDPEWSAPRAATVVTGNPDEYDMWYERYCVELKSFEGRLCIAWRPSSKRHQL